MNILFFHPFVETGKKKRIKTRRATVAAVVENDPDHGLGLRFGVSICSEKDTFVKKYGRAKAAGQAVSAHETAGRWFPNPEQAEKLTEYFISTATEILSMMGYKVLPKERKQKAVAA